MAWDSYLRCRNSENITILAKLQSQCSAHPGYLRVLGESRVWRHVQVLALSTVKSSGITVGPVLVAALASPPATGNKRHARLSAGATSADCLRWFLDGLLNTQGHVLQRGCPRPATEPKSLRP